MVDVADQIVVAILTRAPSAGGKTRLFQELGRPIDRELLAALLLDTIDAIEPVGAPRVVFVTPASAVGEVRAMAPRDVDVVAQGDGDLGARMRGAFDDLFARGARGVVLVGSDLPGLSSSVVREAVDTLDARSACVVLGPAQDGGYYLIGATSTPVILLTGIEWSTADVLASTEARARQSGVETVHLPIARDIDSPADLAAVPPSAVRTQRWLRANAPRLSHKMTGHMHPDG